MEMKFVGSKYKQSEKLDVKDIAKLVRAEIKTAIVKNELPNGAYSVSISRFSGGCSLDIRIKGFEFPFLNSERIQAEIENGGARLEYWEERRLPHYTKIADLALSKLKSIISSYNYDNSDSQTDYFNVRFYGDASFHWEFERAELEKIKNQLAANAKAAA